MSDEWKAPGSDGPTEAELYGLNKYPPMSWHQVLISFHGRIPRSTFWVAYLIWSPLAVAGMIGTVFALVASDIPSVFVDPCTLATVLALSWPTHAILAKRWHDINRSGWSTFWSLIPVIGAVYVLVMVGFVQGTSGRNEYGPGPVYR
jgi:uncharacterized membrane protein YhaH (DUF805 family)